MLKIVTDSASDLPEEIINRYGLHVIPTPVVIDDVDYLDGKTIKTKEFYHILDDTSRNVRTYHINPAMFEDAFRPYAERGDSVLYLCFSTGIAGTFNAANIARTNILEDHPDFDLTIFDTKCASAGFGLLVNQEKAVRARRGLHTEGVVPVRRDQAHRVPAAVGQLTQEWPGQLQQVGLLPHQDAQPGKAQGQGVLLGYRILENISVNQQGVEHPQGRAGGHAALVCDVLEAHGTLPSGHGLHKLDGLFEGLVDLGAFNLHDALPSGQA